MKIWIFNQYAIPPGFPGGTRHYALARELLRRGHDVTVFAGNIHYLTGQEVPLPAGCHVRHEVVDGVPFMWIRTPPYRGNGAGRLRNMLAYAVRIGTPAVEAAARSRPDVVVGSSPHLFGALAAWQIARRQGAAFVLEIRDLWPQSIIDLSVLSPYHPMVWILAQIERHLYRRAQRIVTLLPHAVEHIVAKGGERSRIEWIPNGVDLELFPSEPVEDRSDTHFTVLYAGAHGEANALETVLGAASELQARDDGKRIKFVLVGDGPEKARLQALVAERGIVNVEFRDPVAKKDMAKVLRSADALVVCARNTELYRYGISFNKLFDYLAAGRPILFASGSANNPVADADAGVTVTPENAVALAQAVLELSKRPRAELDDIGARGRAYVEQHFSMQVLGDKLERTLIAAANA